MFSFVGFLLLFCFWRAEKYLNQRWSILSYSHVNVILPVRQIISFQEYVRDDVAMLLMYIGSLLYGWGQGTKLEMAKALTEDKSLPKTTLNCIFQNYSASTQVAMWWMQQTSLDAQLINTALCNRHCVLQSPKQRWAHMYIQYHQLLLTSAELLTVHPRYAQMSLWEEKKM